MAKVKTSVWTVLSAADVAASAGPLLARHFPTPPEARRLFSERPRGKRPPDQTYSVYLKHSDGTLYAAALVRSTDCWHRDAAGRNIWTYTYSNDYNVYRWSEQGQSWNHLATTDGAGPSCLLGRRFDTEHGRTGLDVNIDQDECQRQFTASFKNHLNTYLKKLEKEGACRVVCFCRELSAREAEGTFPTYAIPTPDTLNQSDPGRPGQQTLWVMGAIGNMRHYRTAIYHVWDQFAGAGRRTVHSVWVWYAGNDDWQELTELREMNVAYGTMQKHLEPSYRKWIEYTGG